MSHDPDAVTLTRDGQPSLRTARRLDIQGLRAVAVLAVVLFHAGLPVPGGFVGVDVFFVISGFVITAMLLRERGRHGRIDLATFYIRRFKRLTPALAVMVSFTMIASLFVLSPFGSQQVAAKTAIGAMLWVANFVIASTTGGYFDAPSSFNPLLNTWSLSVEEQFYLIFPALLILGWALARRRFRAAPALIITTVLVGSLMLAVATSLGHQLPQLVTWTGFFSPASRAWEFAAGALLALAVQRGVASTRVTAIGSGALGTLGLLASLWLITDATPFPGVWTLLPVVSTALLLFAGSGARNPVSSALSFRPVVSLGNLSYSWYLWHWPLIVLASVIWPGSVWVLVTAAVVSLAPAAASYAFIEQPIRGLVHVSRKHLVQIVAWTLLPPLALAGGLWLASANSYWNSSVRDFLSPDAQMPSGFEAESCISTKPFANRDFAHCAWNAQATGTPIYLVGDSNAIHFSDGLIEAAEELGRPITALGNSGCPFIDVYLGRLSDPALETQCRANYEALLAWVMEQAPGVVVIGGVDRYWRDADYLVGSSPDLTGATLVANPAELEAGLERTIAALESTGHEVVLVQTIPHYTAEPYATRVSQCSVWSLSRGGCGVDMPREFASQWQATARAGLTAASTATGATLVDLWPFFCDSATCSTSKDGVMVYKSDGFHLTRTGSLMLAPEWKRILSP